MIVCPIVNKINCGDVKKQKTKTIKLLSPENLSFYLARVFWLFKRINVSFP